MALGTRLGKGRANENLRAIGKGSSYLTIDAVFRTLGELAHLPADQ